MTVFHDVEGLTRTGSLQDLVAKLFKSRDGHAPDFVVILHHENIVLPLSCGGKEGAVPCPFRLNRSAKMPRQVKLDGRALTDLRVDFHMAAGLLDIAEHLAEPETGSLAHLLGGEEGFESALDHLDRHARPGVANAHQYILTGGDFVVQQRIAVIKVGVGRLDRQPPAAFHGIAGIDCQVDDRVFQLTGIREGMP